MKKNLFYTAILAAAMLASCSPEKASETPATAATEAPAKAAAGHGGHMATAGMPLQQQSSPTDLMTEDGLPKDLVCMVNNAFMGKEQFPVAFEDKMYYGCCEMCVNTIKNQREVRYAKDPVTGQEVDKSQAFIALEPGGANGEVLYFASGENYRQYAE